MVTAINAGESVLDQLREKLEAGGNLYEAAHRMAGELPASERNALWKDKGGEMLYAWAVKLLGVKRRHVAGLPLGYREGKEEYAQDRIDEVMSQWVGVLDGDAPHLAQLGSLDNDGCEGAAANHDRLVESNGRQATRFRELAKALTNGQTLRDMSPDLFTQIWWAP